jgi:trehalose 6-phosphate synthase/phosphatase
VQSADLSWKAPVRGILEDYTARSPGSFVEEKPVSLVWHYRKVAPGFGMWQARELAQHLSEAFANSPLAVLHGAKVVEVRPQGIDKGRALAAVLNRLGPFGFVLVAGDDRTDEDMFAAPEVEQAGAWTVKVGSGPTHAARRVATPAKLREVLAQLCGKRSRG